STYTRPGPLHATVPGLRIAGRMAAEAAKPLWQPTAERIERAAITRFARAHDLPTDYAAPRRWPAAAAGRFWRTAGAHHEAGARAPGPALADASMPGTVWFPQARLNFARQIFAGREPGRTAIHHASELRPLAAMSWDELTTETARIRASLQGLG